MRLSFSPYDYVRDTQTGAAVEVVAGDAFTTNLAANRVLTAGDNGTVFEFHCYDADSVTELSNTTVPNPSGPMTKEPLELELIGSEGLALRTADALYVFPKVRALLLGC